MEMTIDKHIGVIEDLKSTMSVCMPEPEKTEICTSLSEAIDTMRKYQKITEIVKSKTTRLSYDIGFSQIKKVVENGNDD